MFQSKEFSEQLISYIIKPPEPPYNFGGVGVSPTWACAHLTQLGGGLGVSPTIPDIEIPNPHREVRVLT